MKVTNDFKNTLLHRREIEAVLSSDSNPGFEKVLKALAEHFKSQEDHIVIKSVHGTFGTHDFIVKAYIYDSLEGKKTIEPVKKEKKK